MVVKFYFLMCVVRLFYIFLSCRKLMITFEFKQTSLSFNLALCIEPPPPPKKRLLLFDQKLDRVSCCSKFFLKCHLYAQREAKFYFKSSCFIHKYPLQKWIMRSLFPPREQVLSVHLSQANNNIFSNKECYFKLNVKT